MDYVRFHCENFSRSLLFSFPLFYAALFNECGVLLSLFTITVTQTLLAHIK